MASFLILVPGRLRVREGTQSCIVAVFRFKQIHFTVNVLIRPGVDREAAQAWTRGVKRGRNLRGSGTRESAHCGCP